MIKKWIALTNAFVLCLAFSATAQVQQTILSAREAHTGDAFGYKIAAADSVLLVSAWRADGGLGAAFVFSTGANGWTEERRLDAADHEIVGDSHFGSDVAVNAGYFFVGSGQRSLDRGAVFVFSRESSQSQVSQMIEPSTDGGLFGWSLAASDNLLVVGSLTANARSADVYEPKDGTWEHAGWVTPPDEVSGIDFGVAVGVVDSTIFVGAPLYSESGIKSGAVFVYTQTTNGPVFKQLIRPLNPQDGSQFGYSLSASKTGLAVGASRYQASGIERGAVYYYIRNEYGFTHSQTIESPRSDRSGFPYEVSLSDHWLAATTSPYTGISEVHLFSFGDGGWTHKSTVSEVAGDVLLSGDYLFTGDPRYSGGTVSVYDPSALVTSNAQVQDVPPNDFRAKLRIYPNPARDRLTIVLPPMTDHSFLIEAVNTLGQRVYSRKISVEELTENRTQIETSNWLPGAYFIRVISDSRTAAGAVMLR